MWSVGLTVFSVVVLIGLVSMLGHEDKIHSEYKYQKGWQASLNGKVLETKENVNDYEFSDLKRGDVVELSNHLPEEFKDGQTLTMLVYLSAIEASVDGETIYTYGQDSYRENTLVASGYHFIALPDDCAGKELRITLTVGEDDAYNSLSTPTLTSTKGVYQEFARTHMVSLFICAFLTILGVVLTIFSAIALCFNRNFLRIFYIGLFSFLMGMWSMTNTKVLQIYHVDLVDQTMAEYLMLYLAPIVFFLMLGEMNQGAAKWKKYTIHGLTTLMVAFVTLAIVLQYANIQHYPRLLGYFHILGGMSLVLAAVCMIHRDRKDKDRDQGNKALLIALLVLGGSMALDLVRFNLQKYMFKNETWMTTSVIPIGTLIFVLILLISYLIYIYHILVTRAEKEWLEELAYYDGLCKTYNRTRCSEQFKKLDAGKEPYALINMDLNGLKMINDTYGHIQGDLLLQEFAAILQKAFEEVGDVYRMGGDEFLVIVMEDRFRKIEGALRNMEQLERRRSEELPFTIDTSYGVAKSEECDPAKTEKVYSLADQRMYEMKMKKKRDNLLR